MDSSHELSRSPIIEQQEVSDMEMTAMMRKETEQLRPKEGGRKKLQTRRQSKGLTYFNRSKPTVNIEIGTLEEWYTTRQEAALNSGNKRRRLNMTMMEEDSE